MRKLGKYIFNFVSLFNPSNLTIPLLVSLSRRMHLVLSLEIHHSTVFKILTLNILFEISA